MFELLLLLLLYHLWLLFLFQLLLQPLLFNGMSNNGALLSDRFASEHFLSEMMRLQLMQVCHLQISGPLALLLPGRAAGSDMPAVPRKGSWSPQYGGRNDDTSSESKASVLSSSFVATEDRWVIEPPEVKWLVVVVVQVTPAELLTEPCNKSKLEPLQSALVMQLVAVKE